jgi:hypothetical protein
MSENAFAGMNNGDIGRNSIFNIHKQERCERYNDVDTTSFLENIHIVPSDKFSFFVKGNVSHKTHKKLYIQYSAANPPTYNASFSGSALPFPTEEVAFQNTPNKGTVDVINHEFTFSLRYPNSYYKNMGNIYVKPCVKIVVVDEKNTPISDEVVFNLGEGVPFRTLNWPQNRNWNNGPLFYTNPDLPIRSQYQLLKDSAYPKKNFTPNNFWGIMPPH